MPAEVILRIVSTVATAQLCCDGLAYWRIFSGEGYERARGALSRAKWKRDQALKEAGDTTTTSAPSTEKSSKKQTKADRLAKKLQRAKDDYNQAAAQVAQKHTVPNMLTAFVFVLLLRILGTEHGGEIVGVIPFVPLSFFQRITLRNLQFGDLEFEPLNERVHDVGQACAFMMIYLLSTMSVKFYVHKLFGTAPPSGAEGMMAILNSPMGQSMAKSMGIDPEELKQD